MTLNDAEGQALATFTAQSQSLEGTSWQVISYNNGKQAVTSVLIGSELTADFGTDGTLSGSAGCNNYNGGYEVDGDKITIGPLASTMKMCNEPEGVMDQESQFLAALESAATYKIEGARLELRTADGALAADFPAEISSTQDLQHRDSIRWKSGILRRRCAYGKEHSLSGCHSYQKRRVSV